MAVNHNLNKKIEKSLLETATNPEYAELVQEYAEVGIDELLESDLIDAIPVIKSFVAITNGFKSISDRLFLKKLARFLSEANRLTAEQRATWYEEHIHGDTEIETKLSNKLLFIINSVNDDYKAAVIGKLFRAFIDGKVSTIDHFYFMIELVDGCRTGILKNLAKGIEVNDEALYRVGIVHATSSLTASDIKEILDRDAQLKSRGLTGSSSSAKHKAASYTSNGELLINILRNY